jgi:hypothetical protein
MKAKVNQVEKKTRMSKWEIVKYQILTYCYLKNIQVSDADLECLTLLSIKGEQELTAFCIDVNAKAIFKSSQTVRNALTKAEKKNLILKDGRSKKRIIINPSLNIQTEGNILLDYKFLAVES